VSADRELARSCVGWRDLPSSCPDHSSGARPRQQGEAAAWDTSASEPAAVARRISPSHHQPPRLPITIESSSTPWADDELEKTALTRTPA